MAGLIFKGKAFVQNHHLAVPFHELVPVKSKGLSKKPSLDDNLVVHGDNLKALKALLPTYAGKVKCIYIDPPYNTGTENWVYNDNVNSPMVQEWLGKVVDREDLTRHDKWLCMMTPRQESLRRAEISGTSPGVSDLERIFGMAQSVRAAYTATLANGLHFQLLARQPLSAGILANHINAADGAVNFEIYYDRRDTKTWRLVFGAHTLEFSLPRVFLNAWRRGGEQGIHALRMKQGYFRRIDIVGPFSVNEQGRPLRKGSCLVL